MQLCELLLVARKDGRVQGYDRQWRRLGCKLSCDLFSFRAGDLHPIAKEHWVAETFGDPINQPIKLATQFAQPALESPSLGLSIGGQLLTFFVLGSRLITSS